MKKSVKRIHYLFALLSVLVLSYGIALWPKWQQEEKVLKEKLNRFQQTYQVLESYKAKQATYEKIHQALKLEATGYNRFFPSYTYPYELQEKIVAYLKTFKVSELRVSRQGLSEASEDYGELGILGERYTITYATSVDESLSILKLLLKQLGDLKVEQIHFQKEGNRLWVQLELTLLTRSVYV